MPEAAPAPPPAVALAGRGAVSAAGNGVQSLRDALHSNRSGLAPSDRFEPARFQSNIVGAAPRTGPEDDPAHALASSALGEACQQVRESLARIAPERVGLILATTKANIEAMERLSERRPCSETARHHLQADLLAADLAAEHGARGPIQCVSLACVSGTVALPQAARLIERGDTDAMLVVGVDHLSAFVVAGFTALKALDPMGCRPFDIERQGLSPGEAGAALVLMRQNLAPSGAITLAGWGSSNDANHMTGPSRDGSGLARAIRAALEMAKLNPHDVDYINLHGTGTPYNDAMESAAMLSVFGNACPPFSGSKGLLGHTLGAAGIIETIICALAMEDRLLPGTPRLDTVAEGVPRGIVLTPRPADRLRHVLKINTGFGGVNGTLVLAHD